MTAATAFSAAAALVVVVSAAALAVTAMATAFAVASAAASTVSVASAASVYIFTMESLCKFLLSCLANCEDLACEAEGLAGHLMIEVHLHAVLAHFKNNTRNHCAHAVEHRYCVAWYEKILANLAVDLECCLWKVDDAAWVYLAVTVLWRKSNVECRAWLHALDMLLELRKKAACSMYVIQWSFLSCVVYHLAVHLKFVAEFYYSVLCNFHISVQLNFYYAENETFSNASEGICQRAQLRASVPAAMRLFQSSIKLPVMSISRTG